MKPVDAIFTRGLPKVEVSQSIYHFDASSQQLPEVPASRIINLLEARLIDF